MEEFWAYGDRNPDDMLMGKGGKLNLCTSLTLEYSNI